jgi:peptidoglycan/xylan/chitin deacetylase (PgdA/CDA1 family)
VVSMRGSPGVRLIAVAAAVISVAVLSFALVSCNSARGAADAQTTVLSGTGSTARSGGPLETTTSSLSPSTVPSSTTLRPSSPTLPSSTSSTVGHSSSGTTWPSRPAAKLVRHGPTDKKMIALTFDDNYQTPRSFALVKVLEKFKVPATFFIVGSYASAGPELVRAIAAGGFEVGDHTRDHWNLVKTTEKGLHIQIGGGTDRYHALTGAPTVPLFRPPGGFVDQKTMKVAGEEGFRYTVLWDIDTNDWRGRTAAQIVETVMGNAHNGAIVLMHVAALHTAEALPEVISRLRAAGYDLVTVSTLLGM